MRLLRPRTPLYLIVALVTLACVRGTGPRLLGEGRRVLFIGNSYTYFADIPGIVQAFADSAGGDKLAVETVAYPDFALIDHWREGTAVKEIRKGQWEWVVLQQGPSSTPINRDSLRLLASMFAPEIDRAGARAALFAAWPAASRRQDFIAAIQSYSLATNDVGGMLLPVALGWLEAWERNASVQLYADGLHPSAAGAYLSALIIYSSLLTQTPAGQPATLRLRSGAVLRIDPVLAATFQDAAAAALAQAPPP